MQNSFSTHFLKRMWHGRCCFGRWPMSEQYTLQPLVSSESIITGLLFLLLWNSISHFRLSQRQCRINESHQQFTGILKIFVLIFVVMTYYHMGNGAWTCSKVFNSQLEMCSCKSYTVKIRFIPISQTDADVFLSNVHFLSVK